MSLPVRQDRSLIGDHKPLAAVTVGTAATLVLPANPSRKTATIQAASGNTEGLYYVIGENKTPAVGAGLAVDPGGIIRIDRDDWTGEAVYMICASGGMTANVEESV